MSKSITDILRDAIDERVAIISRAQEQIKAIQAVIDDAMAKAAGQTAPTEPPDCDSGK